jgi:hypothetical protein
MTIPISDSLWLSDERKGEDRGGPWFAEPPLNETVEPHGKRVDKLRSKAGHPSFVHGSIIAHAAEDALVGLGYADRYQPRRRS